MIRSDIRSAYSASGGMSILVMVEHLRSKIGFSETEHKLVLIIKSDPEASVGSVTSECCRAAANACMDPQSSVIPLWRKQNEKIVLLKALTGINLFQLRDECMEVGLPNQIIQVYIALICMTMVT
uniref:peptidyl-tRNA hydrolase n=1 Tax=Spongospora subterranea TaxID=70186 RepID=A0A0H5RQC9_9EUKA|eukprot:CRZ10914.1 hypothetical protein [Spongospora subterranea]